MKHSQQQQQQEDPSKVVSPHPTMDPFSNNPENDDRLREPGAWKCPGCGNENFASRNWCNSKTCDQRRPDHIPAPLPSARAHKRPKVDLTNHYQPSPFHEEGAWNCPKCQFQNFASRERCKGFQCQERRRATTDGSSSITNVGGSTSSRHSRHDPETSKMLVWSKQADSNTLNKNQELRKKYLEKNGGEDMSPEDIERAKILIARDERKRQKRLVQEESTPQAEIEGEIVSSKSTGEEPTVPDVLVDPTIQRKRNRALRKQYVATGGKGMSADDIERAKVLIARDERKRHKRPSVGASE